jgi:hypothetical protein
MRSRPMRVPGRSSLLSPPHRLESTAEIHLGQDSTQNFMQNNLKLTKLIPHGYQRMEKRHSTVRSPSHTRGADSICKVSAARHCARLQELSKGEGTDE